MESLFSPQSLIYNSLDQGDIVGEQARPIEVTVHMVLEYRYLDNAFFLVRVQIERAWMDRGEVRTGSRLSGMKVSYETVGVRILFGA